MDLFPTIADIVGVDAPADYPLDGNSMTKLLTGQRDADLEESFLMHYPHAPHRSDYFTVYRDGDWKVIYHYFPSKVSEGSHYQLYNLADDPFESTNLAESHAAELRMMMQKLSDQLEAHGAVYPTEAAGAAQPVLPVIP